MVDGRSPFEGAPPVYSTNTARPASEGPPGSASWRALRGPGGPARLHACSNRATRLRMTSPVPHLCQLYSLAAADVAVLFKVDPRTATRWAGGYGEPTGLHRALAEALVELHSSEMERAVRRSIQLGGPTALFLTLGANGGKAPRRAVEVLVKAAGLAE